MFDRLQEDSLEAVVALLEKQIAIFPTSKLHQMLGDIYARINDDQKAFENYHISLKWVEIKQKVAMTVKLEDWTNLKINVSWAE